ncbi:glutamate--tRNA ligase [bacterium]|jgi:nondiscriminating glutamyl-tRNA synthetase|nr:glutamate--tRNA ligase [bacterium]MBT4250827.1 glutamate--tRNA ligase [bacterium]MBT4597539.1 glutamate--tRNA ligase [bacterium]MBT6754005.1 glutamate--tRNA ligase [bacterium]MBT7037537.1 glutamate--tRNA ligase [bacterium]
MEVRTRFAPSPTGNVHVGNLRTALYAYLLARNHQGKFLLRVEDTDQKRLVDNSIEKILGALNWAGIEVDEGVSFDKEGNVAENGEYGPYFQSKRLDVYQKYIKELLANGHAYHCFCSAERLTDLRNSQQEKKQPTRYDKRCESLSAKEVEDKIANGESFTIRMNVPQGESVTFKDEVYGKVSFKSDTVDDQVLIKSDGFPTYHFAVVIDDHLMKISHIVRGEDWLPSAPKHVLLYKFFQWETPTMIHVPNVLNENRKKLSKRQGDVSVEDFQKKGYLPETIVNFLSLLGWNPKTKQEHFSLEELEENFDVSGLHKAGAVFDYKKLDWMNAYYIKQKTIEELKILTESYFESFFKEKGFEKDEELVQKIITIEQERMKKLSDVTDNIDFYFTIKNYEKEFLIWKQNSEIQTKDSLGISKKNLEELSDQFTLKEITDSLLAAAGDKRGDLLWPLRVCLSGEKFSPSPFELAWALGKTETLKRIEKALELFEK